MLSFFLAFEHLLWEKQCHYFLDLFSIHATSDETRFQNVVSTTTSSSGRHSGSYRHGQISSQSSPYSTIPFVRLSHRSACCITGSTIQWRDSQRRCPSDVSGSANHYEQAASRGKERHTTPPTGLYHVRGRTVDGETVFAASYWYNQRD